MGEEERTHENNRLAAAGAGAGGIDRAVRQDLDKIRLEGLLAQQDMASELTRAIEETVHAPLAVAEIAGVLDRLEKPIVSELEGLLAGPESSGLRMEKNLLTDLLRDGTEGQAILKRGLVFLKHRRFAEAVEWWTLNRQNLDANTSRLHLLLLLLESLTHLWSGDTQRADATRRQVQAHKLYRAVSPDVPKGLSRAGE